MWWDEACRAQPLSAWAIEQMLNVNHCIACGHSHAAIGRSTGSTAATLGQCLASCNAGRRCGIGAHRLTRDGSQSCRPATLYLSDSMLFYTSAAYSAGWRKYWHIGQYLAACCASRTDPVHIWRLLIQIELISRGLAMASIEATCLGYPAM